MLVFLILLVAPTVWTIGGKKTLGPEFDTTTAISPDAQNTGSTATVVTTTIQTRTTSSACKDYYPDGCPVWNAKKGFCNSHYYTPGDKYFYCAKTCNLC